MNTPTPLKRSKILFLAGSFLLLFGLIFGSVGSSVISSENRYLADGSIASGIVLGKNIKTRRDKDNHTTSDYYVTYRFTPEGEKPIESSSSVDSQKYYELSDGAPVSIQYLKHDPTQNRVAQNPDFVLGYVFLSIGLLIGAVGAGLFVYEIRYRRLLARLNRDGMMVEAILTAVEPGNLTINNVTQWRISYSFRDWKGQEQNGLTPHMPPDVAREWNVGDKGRVKYDKDKPSLNIWLGR